MGEDRGGGLAAQHQHAPFARAAVGEGEAELFVGCDHRIRLGVEEAGEDDRTARREGLGEILGQLDQRARKNVVDDQI